MNSVLLRVRSKLYRQIIGFRMGTNCAPLAAELFCFVMREISCYIFLTILVTKLIGVIDAFNSITRYLDGLHMEMLLSAQVPLVLFENSISMCT